MNDKLFQLTKIDGSGKASYQAGPMIYEEARAALRKCAAWSLSIMNAEGTECDMAATSYRPACLMRIEEFQFAD